MTGPIILHFGAHRTASTSTQRALVAHAAGEGWDRITFAGPETLRPAATRMVHAFAAVPLGWSLAAPIALRLASPKAAKIMRDPNRLRVISEEQFMGLLEDNLLDQRGIYATMARRARTLRRLLGANPVRVILTTRNYADWFASLYSWAIMKQDMPRAAELAIRWAGRPRGWHNVVADIHSIFDDITVVDFDAIEADPRAILRAIVGDEAEHVSPRHAGRSLSAAAVAEVARRRADGDMSPVTKQRAYLRGKWRGAAIQPFPPKDAALLKARYESDLAAIADMGIRVISPNGKRAEA